MRTQYLTTLPTEWEPIARVFAALGDGTRQSILLAFEPGEQLGLKQLVEALPLSRSAVVHHITVLEQSGLLCAEKRGREVLYTVNLEQLIKSLDKVREYAQNDLHELRKLRETRTADAQATQKIKKIKENQS